MNSKGDNIVNNQNKKGIVMLRKPIEIVDGDDMKAIDAEVDKILGKIKRRKTHEDTKPIFKDQLNVGKYYLNILSIFQNKMK